MNRNLLSPMRILGIATLLSVSLFLQCGKTSTKIEGLRTEHLESPLGIDSPAPRLSWRMVDSRKGAMQTSYRILVGTDRRTVEAGEGKIWDSGTVESDACLITYSGNPLEPFTRYWWKVIVGDKKGKPVSSRASWFETATMGDWNPGGEWIDDGKDKDWRPAPYFRKEFKVEKKVASARAYIASAGLNVLYINGKKIGDRVLDPAFTRFDERILYTTWDVTPAIRKGVNALGVLLGNGWYNHQALATWRFDTAYWRARPAFRMDLRITYEDGETETISSDGSWKATSGGPLIYDNVYTGEHYDARLEMDGWNKAGFDDGGWDVACRRESPTRNLVAQAMPPIRMTEEYRTVALNKINDSVWVFDFGQNMAGNVIASISGKAGTEVRLKYGERIFDDGLVDQTNIDYFYMGDKERDPYQTDILLLGDKGVDFTPQFSYKGFRYVQVNASEPLSLDKSSLTARFIHTDFHEAGSLSCSEEMVEKLEHAGRMAYLSNFMGYPTDCPQREKNGWTGDAHIAIETGLYNFDAFTAYEKWMADHRDAQLPNGIFPDIMPTWGWGINAGDHTGDNGLDWTSTIALIPWTLYLHSGDDKPLRDCYDNIKRYVDFAIATSDGFISSWGRGDWVPVTQRSDKQLIMSSFLYVDCVILSKAAALFGNEADRELYSGLAEKVRDAINAKFLNPETGIYADGMQTSMALPLYFGITPEPLRQKVAAALAELVRSKDCHIDAGVHGAKAVPNALAMYGYLEEAWKMAVSDSYPSWGWWIVCGKTTFTENWELEAARDMSDNHIMFGDIAAWFYRWIGGIQPDYENPGFKRTILRPGFPEGLDSFRCAHDTPYGTVVSEWSRNGGEITYKTHIPANSSALLYLPGSDAPEEVPSGYHEFKIKIQ
ncbi:MAG: family 78 glycoside hydrolase catalytic domain [Bacteroidales bacterium]|nr:family 78 glycoside hydrolase catalytic domain [Bacteroidales bacterium]